MVEKLTRFILQKTFVQPGYERAKFYTRWKAKRAREESRERKRKGGEEVEEVRKEASHPIM